MKENEGKDFLTGFSLRKAFGSFLKDLVDYAKQKDKNFSLIFLDLDHFKPFNDKYGHPFGDEVLKYVSSSLRLSFQGSSCDVFRYGGDEFIVVLPEKDPKEAMSLVMRFKNTMARRPFLFGGKFFKITVSCGIAGFPTDADAIEPLIAKADAALYYSKNHGRDICTLAGSMKHKFVRNLSLRVGVTCLVLGVGFLLYTFVLKGVIHRAVNLISHIKVSTAPAKQDIIIMKDGTVRRGTILSETDKGITLGLKVDKGSVSIYLAKSEIGEIKRIPHSSDH